MKYFILIVAFIFISINTDAQTFGTVSFSKKHGINGLDSEDESFAKTEKNIYKFKFSEDKIIYWKGTRKFEFDIEKIENSRFYVKGKPWQIKIINEGAALIWIWGNDNNTVYTHSIENQLKINL